LPEYVVGRPQVLLSCKNHVYTVIRSLLSGRQISRAEFTDKATLPYKQLHEKGP